MIYLFSGVPGSGKSLHTAQLIYEYANCRRDRLIFCNFEVDPTHFRYPERIIFVKNSDLSVELLEKKSY